MRIAINDTPSVISEVWITHCKENGIPFKRVDCSSDNIMEQLADCDSLLWWWGAGERKFALQLTKAVELSGRFVFPTSSDCWITDDKIAQKYLFEAADLSTPRTYTFFDKEAALSWAKTAEYPKIFKLRSSIASKNVWLVKTPSQAARFVTNAFGGGFEASRRTQALVTRIHRFYSRRTLRSLGAVIKHSLRFGALIFPRVHLDMSERGYAYFQDYIPDSSHVYVLFVIDGRAYALRQTVLPGEYQASGNNTFEAGRPEIIPQCCVKLAFSALARLGMESLGLEITCSGSKPIIIEADPFGAMWKVFPGFWDDSLHWHEEAIVPAREVIMRFLKLRKLAKRPTVSVTGDPESTTYS